MAKLSESQIREIIQKANLLQKFSQAKTSFNPPDYSKETKQLFEISDELNIPRRFVYEAYLEHTRIPVHEPILADTLDYNSAKAMGFANGSIDGELLSDLKNQIEYHFNTMGKLSHRRNKIVWKAKPSGVSRLIASATSPEVELEQVDGNTKISVTQSLKTNNKLFLPAAISGLGGLFLLAAVLFQRTGPDSAPVILISALILFLTLFYTRFVQNRAKKKKKNLLDLTETLQGKIERHFKAKVTTPGEKTEGEIKLPEGQETIENIDLMENKSSRKMKE